MIRRSIFITPTKRPLLCRYMTAYLLLGVGATLVDIGAGPKPDRWVEATGVIIGVGGLFVFVASIGYSLRFVLRRTPTQSNCCLTCGYNLTGNTSGVCPECGAMVDGKSRASA